MEFQSARATSGSLPAPNSQHRLVKVKCRYGCRIVFLHAVRVQSINSSKQK